MKKSKALIVTLLAAATFTTVLPQSVVFAKDKIHTTIEGAEGAEQRTARYALISSVTLSARINDNGASYSLYVTGMSDVNRISGTTTLYKKSASGSYHAVDSEYIDEATNDLSWSSSLSTDGSGSYRLKFVGTVYTENDSERFSKSITKSY